MLVNLVVAAVLIISDFWRKRAFAARGFEAVITSVLSVRRHVTGPNEWLLIGKHLQIQLRANETAAGVITRSECTLCISLSHDLNFFLCMQNARFVFHSVYKKIITMPTCLWVLANITVCDWVLNDTYLQHRHEVAKWSPGSDHWKLLLAASARPMPTFDQTACECGADSQ